MELEGIIEAGVVVVEPSAGLDDDNDDAETPRLLLRPKNESSRPADVNDSCGGPLLTCEDVAGGVGSVDGGLIVTCGTDTMCDDDPPPPDRPLIVPAGSRLSAVFPLPGFGMSSNAEGSGIDRL